MNIDIHAVTTNKTILRWREQAFNEALIKVVKHLYEFGDKKNIASIMSEAITPIIKMQRHEYD